MADQGSTRAPASQENTARPKVEGSRRSAGNHQAYQGGKREDRTARPARERRGLPAQNPTDGHDDQTVDKPPHTCPMVLDDGCWAR